MKLTCVHARASITHTHTHTHTHACIKCSVNSSSHPLSATPPLQQHPQTAWVNSQWRWCGTGAHGRVCGCWTSTVEEGGQTPPWPPGSPGDTAHRATQRRVGHNYGGWYLICWIQTNIDKELAVCGLVRVIVVLNWVALHYTRGTCPSTYSQTDRSTDTSTNTPSSYAHGSLQQSHTSCLLMPINVR